jgi:GNAT superfamily N-acetyltransferase
VEIVSFDPEMAPALAQCYNELMAPVPYHRPAAPEWFADLSPTCFQECMEQEVLVAREGRDVVGFVHVGRSAPPVRDWHAEGEPGVIRFLSYRPGERAIGAALLARAEEWIREHGRTEVLALDGRYLYPFYPLQLGHISERVSHVLPLLWTSGYESDECEVFFDWPDFVPPPVPEPDLAFTLAREETRATPPRGITVRAMQGDEEVGHCIMSLFTGDPYRPQFDGWCICDHLMVDEPQRRRGLGKYLLAAALTAMREAGARHAMIDTGSDNYRAYLLYTNFGYRFLDRTFGPRKTLT